jgi:hypothetical protein
MNFYNEKFNVLWEQVNNSPECSVCLLNVKGPKGRKVENFIKNLIIACLTAHSKGIDDFNEEGFGLKQMFIKFEHCFTIPNLIKHSTHKYIILFNPIIYYMCSSFF